MRRALIVIGFTAVLGLAACSSGGSSGGSGTGTGAGTSNTTAVSPSGQVDVGNGITDPINQAKSVVGQQNAQLRQEQQRTGSADPTSP